MFSMTVDVMGAKDEVPISYDQRNTEKVIEHNFQMFCCFKEGVVYRNVATVPYNTLKQRKFNRNQDNLIWTTYIIDFDIKQDFMSARFKTAFITYCDKEGKEQVRVAKK